MCSFTVYRYSCKKHNFDVIEANCGASHPAPWPTVNINMSKECRICGPPTVPATRVFPDVIISASSPPTAAPLKLVSDLAPTAPFPLYAFSAADYEADIGIPDFSDDKSDSEQSGWDAEVAAYLNELEDEIELSSEKLQELKSTVPESAFEIFVRFELTRDKSCEMSERDIQTTLAVYKQALERQRKDKEAADQEKWLAESKEHSGIKTECKEGENEFVLPDTEEHAEVECDKAYKEKNRRATLAALTNEVCKDTLNNENQFGKGKSGIEKTVLDGEPSQVPKMLCDTNSTTLKPNSKKSDVMKMIKKFEAASL
jgi:hypothetical protein